MMADDDNAGAPLGPIDRGAAAHVGQPVTLLGTALDAYGGAVVMLADRTPVYVTGLAEWDGALFRKKLLVTGALARKKLAPDASVNAKGEVSHGNEGDDLVINDATWSLA